MFSVYCFPPPPKKWTRLHDHFFLLGTGACSTLRENLAWSFKSPCLEGKDGLVVRRLNSRDLAPNPIGLQVPPWSGTQSSLGHRFYFHIYLQWALISRGSPCTTSIWVKFSGRTHKSMWALTFLKKISVSYVSITYIKMPSTNFSISNILGKMKSNSKILNNMIHIPVIKNN